MTIGLALFKWDSKIGAVLEAQFPKNFNLGFALLNKIYMTHSYAEEMKDEELIEINYEDKIILSYCDKTRIPKFGYEIFIIMLHEKEKPNIFKIKQQILSFVKELFKQPLPSRKEFFLQNTEKFIQKPTAKKILLLGRAGTGKTSINKIIFEGWPPKDLLYNPLEPTRGITPSVHSWLDLKIGLFDSAGQELNYLLQDEDEQLRAFENTDVVIYLIDFSTWMSIQKEIVNEINQIQKILGKMEEKTEFILFFHKIDLINQLTRDKVIIDLREKIETQVNNKLYFTSIHPDLIYTLYNAFYEILSSFSKQTSYLKETLDLIIKEFSKTMCFITNLDNNIIVQTMNPDFNPSLINHSHKLIVLLTRSFKDMTSKDEISHLIISGKKNMNIIMNNLNITKFNMNNLICISESLSANKLITLAGKVRLEINTLYYLNGVSSKNE